MKTLGDPKRWLLIGALALLMPALALANGPDRHKGGGCDNRDSRNSRGCQPVPDGGSTAGYLLAVGATCLGAMVLRSRSSKARLS